LDAAGNKGRKLPLKDLIIQPQNTPRINTRSGSRSRGVDGGRRNNGNRCTSSNCSSSSSATESSSSANTIYSGSAESVRSFLRELSVRTLGYDLLRAQQERAVGTTARARTG
ncbi:unnamed protein product, partial [Amoebophrya sp. A120]